MWITFQCDHSVPYSTVLWTNTKIWIQKIWNLLGRMEQRSNNYHMYCYTMLGLLQNTECDKHVNITRLEACLSGLSGGQGPFDDHLGASLSGLLSPSLPNSACDSKVTRILYGQEGGGPGIGQSTCTTFFVTLLHWRRSVEEVGKNWRTRSCVYYGECRGVIGNKELAWCSRPL